MTTTNTRECLLLSAELVVDTATTVSVNTKKDSFTMAHTTVVFLYMPYTPNSCERDIRIKQTLNKCSKSVKPPKQLIPTPNTSIPFKPSSLFR